MLPSRSAPLASRPRSRPAAPSCSPGSPRTAPRLVLLDLVMPPPDGYAVLTALTRRPAGQPISRSHSAHRARLRRRRGARVREWAADDFVTASRFARPSSSPASAASSGSASTSKRSARRSTTPRNRARADPGALFDARFSQHPVHRRPPDRARSRASIAAAHRPASEAWATSSTVVAASDDKELPRCFR